VDVAVMLALRIRLLLLAYSLQRFDVFGIGDRAGDDVSAARPLSEIDQSTTLAAERELRILAQDQLTARGTTQAEPLLPGPGFILIV